VEPEYVARVGVLVVIEQVRAPAVVVYDVLRQNVTVEALELWSVTFPSSTAVVAPTADTPRVYALGAIPDALAGATATTELASIPTARETAVAEKIPERRDMAFINGSLGQT
jgi:hypothetical protein